MTQLAPPLVPELLIAYTSAYAIYLCIFLELGSHFRSGTICLFFLSLGYPIYRHLFGDSITAYTIYIFFAIIINITFIFVIDIVGIKCTDANYRDEAFSLGFFLGISFWSRILYDITYHEYGYIPRHVLFIFIIIIVFWCIIIYQSIAFMIGTILGLFICFICHYFHYEICGICYNIKDYYNNWY